MFKMSVNDTAERYFDAIKGHLQYYYQIGLTNAVGVSQAIVNGDLLRGFDTSYKKIPNGSREYSMIS